MSENKSETTPTQATATQLMDAIAETQLPPLINSPQGLMLGGGLLLLLVLSLLQSKSGKKGKLAKGRFGGSVEKARAKTKALEQLRAREKDAVSVWIGTPTQNPLSREQPIYLPDAQRGIAVLGAPGTGKTVSVIDQVSLSVLEQGFPLILWDFKYPTQTSRLAPYAAKCGYDVRVFAPGFPESECCNPLDFLRDETDSLMARQLAEVMNANFKKIGRATEDGFFGPAGDQVTEAILMLSKGSRYPDLMMAQALCSKTSLAKQLIANKGQLNPWIAVSFGQLIASADSEKTVSGILATAANNLSRFMKPELVPAFVGRSTIPTRLAGKQLLILGLEREKREVMAPLIATVLHLLINKNVIGRKEPLFLIADEVPTLYLPSLRHWLNENREDGLCTVLGFQNVVQMEELYGKELSRAIIGGCGTKIIFNPQDPETAKMLSDYLGEKEVSFFQKSKSRSGGKLSTNLSEHTQTRPLFEAAEFLRLPTGRCIILNPHFFNGIDAYIPLLFSIKLTSDYQTITRWSRQCWQKVRDRLIKRSPKKQITERELKARDDETQIMFPDLQQQEKDTFLKSFS